MTRCCSLLQWGRRCEATEGWPSPNSAASATSSFNGAVAVKRRKDWKSLGSTGLYVMLQWGRRCEATEGRVPPVSLAGLLRLQWGRRCEATEGDVAMGERGLDVRFNGAVAVKRRKARVLSQ